MMRNLDLVRLRGQPFAVKTLASMWGAPDCSQAFATVEVDVRETRAWMERVDAAGQGVTMAHLVARAVALALARCATLNALVRFGEFYQRRSIDIYLPTPMTRSDGIRYMGGVLVRGADKKSPFEIAREVACGVEEARAKEKAYDEVSRRLRWMPIGLVRALLRLMRLISTTLNLRLPGAPNAGTGGCMVADVGGLGLDQVYSPLLPLLDYPLVLAVGRVRERLALRDGEVQADPVVALNATFDHRFGDAVFVADFIATVLECFRHPDLHFQGSELEAPRGAAQPPGASAPGAAAAGFTSP